MLRSFALGHFRYCRVPLCYLAHFTRIPNFFANFNILKFSDIEPRLILKFYLNTKGVTSPKKFEEHIPIFVTVPLHHKSKQEFIF